jgi:hypothetical protein
LNDEEFLENNYGIYQSHYFIIFLLQLAAEIWSTRKIILKQTGSGDETEEVNPIL